MRIFTLLSFFLSFILSAKAQDTIGVMHFNLLYFGQTTSSCNNTTNNLTQKIINLRKIVHNKKPTVFTCNEVGWSGFGSRQDSIKDRVLNHYGISKYKLVYVSNRKNSDITNGFFYDSTKLFFIKKDYILGSVRDIDVITMGYNSLLLGTGVDTVKITFIIAHLKAGSTSSDAADRSKDMDLVNGYLNSFPSNANVLFMGDFNIYSGTETAWTKIRASTNKVVFKDPLGLNNWSGSTPWAQTQSPHQNAPNACYVGGGLDNRFDFILISNEINTLSTDVDYINGSYKAIGNDGQRYNDVLTSSFKKNTSEPDSVINALMTVSDHLPVYLKLKITQPTKVNIKPLLSSSSWTVWHNEGLLYLKCLNQRSSQPSMLRIYSVNGQFISEHTLGQKGNAQVQTLPFSAQKGLYFVEISTENAREAHKIMIW